jgi:hypothetical protein
VGINASECNESTTSWEGAEMDETRAEGTVKEDEGELQETWGAAKDVVDGHDDESGR